MKTENLTSENIIKNQDEISPHDKTFAESLYNDDDDEIIYAAYDGSEAEKIIIPAESDNEIEIVISKKDNELKKEQKVRRKMSLSEFLSFFFHSIPDFIERTGDVTISFIKTIFIKTGPFIAIPFAFIFSVLMKTLSSVKNFFVSIPKNFLQEVRSISYEVKIIRKQIKRADGNNNEKISFLRAMRKYFLISFSRHSIFWKSVFNTVFPIAVIIIIVFVFSGAKSKITALEITYNGKNIGYVESDDVFESARNLAVQLLPAQAGKNDYSSILKSEPVYKISRVSLNELSNDRMICEKIISATDETLVRACGIYIDGDFFCAITNESDASSVFESLLLPHKDENDKDKIVAFVEEIDYVEGLYPEDSVWDSLKLSQTLKTPKTEEKYYKVKKDDSAKLIAKKYSLTVNQLKALNPNVDFTKLKKGQKILVAAQTNYVRVKVMKTRTKTEKIEYETVKKQSSSILKGTTKTVQKGKNGKKVITELVTYINNVETYSVVISEKQTVAPTNEIIYVGTKTASSSSSDYSYTSGGSVSGSSSGFIWPSRGAYGISSGYGYRSASISGWSFHGGVDIVKPGGGSTGTPVVAAASGTVVVAQSGYTGYGHTVVIDHGNGLRTRYAHMQPGSLRVRVGQSVYQGQQIGNIGSTGNVTGPHLHFEVLKNGTKVNPLPYIR